MRFELELDEDKVNAKLSWRERQGVRLLIVIFCIVYPARYSHQVKEIFEGLIKDT